MLTNLRDAFGVQSRSPNIVPFHMQGVVSYCAIVTLSLFDFKKCCDLEMGSKVTQGHWEWYHLIDGVLVLLVTLLLVLVFFSNFVPKMHRFWDIWLQKCRDLKNRVRGPSRSLEMSPCNRAHMTSYWRSIVIMALSCVISEIFLPRAGSGVVRMDPLRFLAGCRTRRLNQAWFLF